MLYQRFGLVLEVQKGFLKKAEVLVTTQTFMFYGLIIYIIIALVWTLFVLI